jgi:hypothetical protein
MIESYDVIIGSGKSILLLERGGPGPGPARAAS